MSNWPDFEVPRTWRVVETRELASLMKSGGTPSRRVAGYWDGDIPFALIEDMTSAGLYLDRTSERITSDGLDASSAWIVPPGAVLLSMYATIGATVVNRIPLATNQAILAIVPRSDVSAEFLAFCLRAHRAALSARNVQATQKNINKGIVETFPLPIPPFPEQKRIAAVLGLAQRAIEQQERLIALTTELKKSLMHKLFTEGLRGEPQKQTEMGPAPESWVVTELSGLLEIKHGFAFEGEFFASDGHYILLTPGHFFEDGGFRDQKDKTTFYAGEFPRGYLLAKGDLLVVMTEQKAGLLGSSIIIPESDRYLHNQRLGLIDKLDETRLDKLFLCYYFNTAEVRKHIAMNSSGSKVRHTSPGKIRELRIALPSVDEQRQIVAILQAADAKADLLCRKHTALSDLFRTLLHQLMTGQIRVGEIGIDPQSATIGGKWSGSCR
jgi:type I restriction enzyme, S subunit